MADFIGTAIADGNLVGDFSLVQLWNPPNSCKTLTVHSVTIAVTTWAQTPPGTRAGDMLKSCAPLNTLTGNTTNINFADPTTPVAQFYESQVVPATQTGVKPFHEWWIGASETDRLYPFNPPILVPPGYGIIIRGAQTAMYVVTTWQWSEA